MFRDQFPSLLAPSDEGRFPLSGGNGQRPKGVGSCRRSRLRERHLNCTVCPFAHLRERLLHIPITAPQDPQPHLLQCSGAFPVPLSLLCLIMSAAVQFYNQSGLCAIKIRYIISNGFLPLKTEGIILEELIPQFAFPRGHIFTQLFGPGDVLLSIRLHVLYSVLTPASRPRRRGRR